MNGCIVLTAKEPEPELLASLRVVENCRRGNRSRREFIGVGGGVCSKTLTSEALPKVGQPDKPGVNTP
jgi:toxic protein SymE